MAYATHSVCRTRRKPDGEPHPGQTISFTAGTVPRDAAGIIPAATQPSHFLQLAPTGLGLLQEREGERGRGCPYLLEEYKRQWQKQGKTYQSAELKFPINTSDSLLNEALITLCSFVKIEG